MSEYLSKTFTPGQAPKAAEWLNAEPAGVAVAIGAGRSGRYVITKRLTPILRQQAVAELVEGDAIDKFLNGGELHAMGAVGERTIVVMGLPSGGTQIVPAGNDGEPRKPRKKAAKKTAEKEVAA